MLINSIIGMYSKDKSLWIPKESLVKKVIFAALYLNFERFVELRQKGKYCGPENQNDLWWPECISEQSMFLRVRERKFILSNGD